MISFATLELSSVSVLRKVHIGMHAEVGKAVHWFLNLFKHFLRNFSKNTAYVPFTGLPWNVNHYQ